MLNGRKSRSSRMRTSRAPSWSRPGRTQTSLWVPRASPPSSSTATPRTAGDRGEGRGASSACVARTGRTSCSRTCGCRWRSRIGEENEGFRFFMETLDAGRIAVGAIALGSRAGSALTARCSTPRSASRSGSHSRSSKPSRSSSPTWPPASKPPGTSSITDCGLKDQGAANVPQGGGDREELRRADGELLWPTRRSRSSAATAT